AALAAARAAAAALAEQVAEQIVEQVAERGEVRGAREAAGPACADALEAEAIVRAALLRIGEHGVRLRRLLEPFLGVGLVRIAVRVVLQRELAVALLELFVRRAARDSEHVVVVALRQSRWRSSRSCVATGSRRCSRASRRVVPSFGRKAPTVRQPRR